MTGCRCRYTPDNDITYGVDTATTACWATSSQPGNVLVTDNAATPYNAVVALISHGNDGHGAWLPLAGAGSGAQRLNAGSTDQDQRLNAHVTTGFVSTSPNSQGATLEGTTSTFVTKSPTPPASFTSASGFDDIVYYKSPRFSISNVTRKHHYARLPCPPNTSITPETR